MRDIRFRAWHKKLKKMEFIGILNLMDMSYLPDYSYDQAWEEDDIELMEWTGLYDKNQVPVYEGDILNGTQEVMFLGGQFSVRTLPYNDDWEPLKDYLFESSDAVVTGNIYNLQEGHEEKTG